MQLLCVFCSAAFLSGSVSGLKRRLLGFERDEDAAVYDSYITKILFMCGCTCRNGTHWVQRSIAAMQNVNMSGERN